MTRRRERSKPQVNKQLAGNTDESTGFCRLSEETDTVSLEGGKFCLDVAKLVFAGVILASIMKEESDTSLLYFVGIIVVLFFVMFGFYLISKSKKRR